MAGELQEIGGNSLPAYRLFEFLAVIVSNDTSVDPWKSDEVGGVACGHGDCISRGSDESDLGRENGIGIEALVSGGGKTTAANIGPKISRFVDGWGGDRVIG
jgi:hypothetical protein